MPPGTTASEVKPAPPVRVRISRGLHKARDEPLTSSSKRRADLVLLGIRQMISGPTALEMVSQQSGSDPFRVLISTMLSARTRDPVTNAASDRLFSEYGDATSLARARVSRVKRLIKPVSFYRVKSRRIIEVSKILLERYGGKVPENFDAMLELPGVGRKTANCVLVYGFRQPAIPVDVHVHRISNRIGIVSTKIPDETEVELSKIYSRDQWLDVNELFVRFGQTICKPVVPNCGVCLLPKICRYYQTVVRKKNQPPTRLKR